MRKIIWLGDRFLEVSNNSRQPWSHFKIHDRGNYKHLVFGKLSIQFGKPNCELCKDDGFYTDAKGREVSCAECCEHSETDHGICLDCGSDEYENMAAAAYDYAKDLKKYG